ncbi:MAG: hypothetical protein AABY07_02940 [Nanoarchaeota archaeon]
MNNRLLTYEEQELALPEEINGYIPSIAQEHLAVCKAQDQKTAKCYNFSHK